MWTVSNFGGRKAAAGWRSLLPFLKKPPHCGFPDPKICSSWNTGLCSHLKSRLPKKMLEGTEPKRKSLETFFLVVSIQAKFAVVSNLCVKQISYGF